MGTPGSFGSGVKSRPRESTSWMKSLWPRTVPQVAYRSVRRLGVPFRKSSGVVAEGLKPSILPHRLLNSARVRSLVQHLADAGWPLAAGVKGLVHLAPELGGDDVGRGRQVALVVPADELKILGERDVALLHAGAHTGPGQDGLGGLFGELQASSSSVPNAERRRLHRHLGAAGELLLEAALVHVVDKVVRARPQLDAGDGILGRLGVVVPVRPVLEGASRHAGDGEDAGGERGGLDMHACGRNTISLERRPETMRPEARRSRES